MAEEKLDPRYLDEAGELLQAEELLMKEDPELPQFMKMGAAANQDPWANRSAKMKCISCMWYAGKNDEVGRCRRNAPTMNGYPVVYAKRDWCGQHKLDELFVGV